MSFDGQEMTKPLSIRSHRASRIGDPRGAPAWYHSPFLIIPSGWRETAVLESWLQGWLAKDIIRLSGMSLAEVIAIIKNHVRPKKKSKHRLEVLARYAQKQLEYELAHPLEINWHADAESEK